MKDVETIRPDRFAIPAMLERADTKDRLIGAESLEALAEGAIVGTSSPRRSAQLRARRPDLRTVPIRGNVQTRLARIARGEMDATLLAAAGLDRLGIIEGVPLDLLPAPAQGAIGVEISAGRDDLREMLAAIDHRPTHEAVDAERAFLAALGGDCHSAIAALAQSGVLRAEILSGDGSEVHIGEGEPEELARRLLAKASPALRATFGR
jgi:hydroxymethylbilane synthase